MARRKKQIEARQVLKLAEIGCNASEIGVVLGCSADTIEGRFSEIFIKGKENLKLKLRRAQVRLALSGDRTMLIWLGKQMLGQRDVQYLEIGDVSQFSDEELEDIARGEIPSGARIKTTPAGKSFIN